jgi:hypothetical protein
MTYIPDGYNFDEFIKAELPLYGDLRFVRRHMPIDDIEQWSELANRPRTVAERNSVYRDMVIAALVSWDLKLPGGKPAPIDQDTLNKHVHRALWTRLVGIVLGISAPDLPPGVSEQQRDDWRAQVAALKEKQNAAATVDAAHEKNSATG